jgi:hypothetical protein
MISMILLSIKTKNHIHNPILFMGISSLVKTDFDKMDEHFKEIGPIFKSFLIEEKDFEKMDFVRGAFSELMLNNLSFSQSDLFSGKYIRMIESKLQVGLLLDGKYFILLPNVLVKCSDIQFKFE